MNRTRLLLVAVLSAAALLVVGALVWRMIAGDPAILGLASARPQKLRIRILTAPSAASWARSAADAFSAEARGIDGAPIEIEIVPLDGLTALGKWERNDFDALPAEMRPSSLPDRERADLDNFPTAWIPESRFLVEMANASYRARLGRDVFLSDGQYRVRPVAASVLAWGIFRNRGAALMENLGALSWSTFHDAAAAPTGWKELGGDPAWGRFKLAIPDARKTASGLAVLFGAAGEYYNHADVSMEDVSDSQFQAWLAELIRAANHGGHGTAAEDLALFGYSAGDGGQFLESDLLQHLQGILTRWEEPLIIRYPEFNTRFDYSFAIWIGAETTAQKKNAALAFQKFLLSEAQQRKALSFGLRPANPDAAVDAADDSLFARWRQLGIRDGMPRTAAMRPPSRDAMLALLRLYDLNAAP